MIKSWLVCIATALSAGACASPPTQKPPDRLAAAPTTAAELVELPSSIEAGGVVRARIAAAIASRVMAPIVDVRVHAGSRVRRGDVLVTLDARELRANDERSRAATMAASESVRAAEADMRAGQSAVKLARLTHERIAALQARRSATAAELDQAVAALAAAEAQHAAAQARLAAATAGGDEARAAALGTAVALSYATLTAPFDGIVAERGVDPGSMAAPGTPLLIVEDPATYRLEVRLDESRAAALTVDSPAAVQFEHRDGAIPGRVSEIARVDSTSHTFLVKIDLPPGSDVRSGQFGRASFDGPRRRALTIPSSALVRRGQLTFVYIVDADHHLRLQPVSVAATAGGRLEVLAGVRDGDRVVTSPAAAAGDGAAKRAQP